MELGTERGPSPTGLSADAAEQGRWRGRSVGLADQVCSSVSNILAVVLVARVLSADDFGRFALGYTMLTLALALSRSYFGTQIAMCGSRAAADALTRQVLGALLLLAAPLAALVLGLSLLASGGGRGAVAVLVVVALATPVVCLQDALRFSATATGRPGVALASDGLWLAVMVVPFVLQLRLTSTAALVVYLVAALAALTTALVLTAQRPDLRGGASALRRRDPLAESLTLSGALTNGATLLVLFVVAQALGPAAAGALRGATSAMGPVNVLLAFSTISLTPALVRRERGGDARFCGATALALGLAVLGWGAVLLLAPDPVGRAAFGDSWAGMREVLPLTVLEYVLVCASAAATLGLTVRRRAGELLRGKLAYGLVTVLAGAGAALLARTPTAVALGFVVAALTSALVGWWQFSRSVPRFSPFLRYAPLHAAGRRG